MAEPILEPTSTVRRPPPALTGRSAHKARRTAADAVAADVAAVVGILVVLGLLCGVMWWLLATPAEYTKLRDGAVLTENQLGRQFSVDGVYVVVALGTGLVAGLLLAWWRSRDPLLTSLLLVVGSLAAAGVMALTGHLLGPDDPKAVLAASTVGARVPETLSVTALTAYLAWPVGVLAGALIVLLGGEGGQGSEPVPDTPGSASG
jgi:hypothetical protein